ncbi:triokinase/FMN cyclase [Ciona intestinalis]
MSRTNRLLINNAETCVDEMLQSIAWQNPGQRLLKGHRVIIREDAADFCSSGHVSTICGGGSGHEPFSAGFVGRGMLTAAVAGSVFASPPPNDILAAINAVASPAGTLLIVANYTGDRLNFGIALERAKAAGKKVNMVVVGEDCALESQDKTAGRRGLVGIVIVMKLAGALAEQGRSLDEITQACTHLSKAMGTIGVSLSGCSIPGTGSSFKLDETEMELGLGAHGEAGVRRMKILPANETVEVMIDHMMNPSHASHITIDNGQKIALTMNNLGGLSEIEMYVLGRKAIEYLESKGLSVVRCYNGHFMTSLDMAGFNLNICKVNDETLKCLDADTNAPGWPRVCVSNNTGFHRRNNDPVVSLNEKSLEVVGENVNSADKNKLQVGHALIEAITLACQSLISNEAFLNDLDTSAGDGDCGSTLKRGANEVLNRSRSWKCENVEQVLLQIAGCAEKSMGGASGGLYSLFFTAASHRAQAYTIESWNDCLVVGIAAISKYGGAEPGDRTMLDALVATRKSLEKSISEDASIKTAAQNAAKVARQATEATATMKAKAGRASCVAAKLLTQPDPGAMAVAIWVEAVAKTL